jgi:acyl-CoA dehydrogenase
VSRSSTDAIRPFLEASHVELAAELAGAVPKWLAPFPAVEEDGAARRQARELVGLLGGAGWLRHAAPERGEPDTRACCLVREALAAASPLADAVFALQALGAYPLIAAGSPELRRRWLPEIAAGRAMAAFAMTEPDAGSDVGRSPRPRGAPATPTVSMAARP